MEYKSKTFFSLQQSVKDSRLKKSDFPSQGDFLCAFNQSVSLGNYFFIMNCIFARVCFFVKMVKNISLLAVFLFRKNKKLAASHVGF